MKKNTAGDLDILQQLSPHFLSFLLPAYALLFLTTGPHHWLAALLWIIPVWMTVLIDRYSPAFRDKPRPAPSPYAFDAILLVLAGLQLINIIFLLHMASQLPWSNTQQFLTSLCNLFAIKVVIGTSSSFSGIVVAHELIHRSQAPLKNLGRILLCLECYEHFATEHIRGHHANVGTNEDPATARYGESFESFWKRTVPAQFKHAWTLEDKRLRLSRQNRLSWKIFQHRVFQGLMFEVALLLSIVEFFGLTALIAFALQALAAVRKLETVNYIEHWGLERGADEKDRMLSWDTDSWFTLNTLVGLSRHADHHQYATRPYPELDYHPESPKLPYGYFAMVFITVFNNQHYRFLAAKELNARGLCPDSFSDQNPE